MVCGLDVGTLTYLNIKMCISMPIFIGMMVCKEHILSFDTGLNLLKAGMALIGHWASFVTQTWQFWQLDFYTIIYMKFSEHTHRFDYFRIFSDIPTLLPSGPEQR